MSASDSALVLKDQQRVSMSQASRMFKKAVQQGRSEGRGEAYASVR